MRWHLFAFIIKYIYYPKLHKFSYDFLIENILLIYQLQKFSDINYTNHIFRK